MPGGMNGLELAAVVHQRWPQVAIVVTSGVMRVGAEKLPGDGVFTPKPYATKTPVRVICELIRQHGAPAGAGAH